MLRVSFLNEEPKISRDGIVISRADVYSLCGRFLEALN